MTLRQTSQPTLYQRNPEQIRTARGELVQGNSDDYFQIAHIDRQDTGSVWSVNSPDIPEDVRYLGQSSESTLDELGSPGGSSSTSTPRPYDRLANAVARAESIESHELLRPPSGLRTPTPGDQPKPILKQSLTSLLAEKRSSLHDILSTSPDLESRQTRRVSFAARDEFSPSVIPAQSEDSTASVSEVEDSTTTEQRLKGMTRMLFFELERRLKASTPTPSNSGNPLLRSSSSASLHEPEPLVDFVQVLPWDDREYHSGQNTSGSSSLQQIKAQVLTWCDRHGDDGGPRQMVELRTLPVELQDLILEFERSRIEQSQGHGKRKNRIVHIDVSRILNSP